MIDKARETALKILYKIDVDRAYSNLVLNEEIKKNKKILNEKDISLISEIAYGVTTWRLTLDEIIKKYSKIRLKKISSWILNILRMGIYQIIFLDKIPKSAAVNESVNLAKRYGHNSSSSFVNAILRKVEKNDYEDFFKIENDVERISKTTSMPEWIIKELLTNNNIKIVENICKNLNLKPKTTLRINKLKTTKEEIKKILDEENINYKESDYDDFLILEKVKDIENLKLFKNGFATIQDISAGLAVKTLNPQSGDKILDACAAPGGKTTYIGELMKNKGEILAWDMYKHRTNLIEQNAKRLGIDIIKIEVNNATIYNEELNEKFDKILLDVPCLGIGVIKRKPDIKWQRKPEDLIEINNIQKAILNNCSKYLKIGGTLIYCTCSILEKENEKIVSNFLNENKNFVFEKERTISINADIDRDGFFICKLNKK